MSALGGPAPYWQSWTFDSAGDRKTETVHTAAATTTTNYNYPVAGGTRPHAVTSTTAGSTTLNYQYDNTGNTTCRPASGGANTCPAGTGSQALTWDAEGHLATATDSSGTSRYIYAVDGTRLVADDPAATTLYLPSMELKRAKATGAVTATRYYTWAGQTVATMTTGGAVTWLIADHQNTQNIAITAGIQTVTIRRQNPYGTPRGGTPAWPNSKGFVSGDRDATGLTHVGAREYDPGTGRFVSVDPVFAPTDPSSMNGYAYSSNSPVTLSDPSGRRPDCTGDCLKNWAAVQLEGRTHAAEVKAQQDKIDNDIKAHCDSACARRRAAKARIADRNHFVVPYLEGNPYLQETVVATGGEQQFALEDVPLSAPFGNPYVAEDFETSVTVSETTEWSDSLANARSLTAEVSASSGIVSGSFSASAEESFSYTFTKSTGTERTLIRTYHTEPGQEMIVVPKVAVKWELVNYSGKDPYGNPVSYNKMRMNMQFLGPAVVPVKPGAVPTGGTGPSDLAVSVLKHLG
ncbi:RHS repeat-associated core domain-containing protein [Dactylosporangium sp. NPDC051484]|uniref:RHS repeat-associated core domain-containing protein n=1 Tax=Dactylosporangium sp. NPDC051484 TaxID=3154942 RepID=UPI00344E2604